MIIGNCAKSLPVFSSPPDQYISTSQFRSADLVSSQMIGAGASMPVARWRSSLGRDAVTRNFSHHTIILQNAGDDVRRIDSACYSDRRSTSGSLLILPAGMQAAWRSEQISDRTHYYVHPNLVENLSQEILGRKSQVTDDAIFVIDPKFADLLQRYLFVLESGVSSRLERDMAMLEVVVMLIRRYCVPEPEKRVSQPDEAASLFRFVDDNLSDKLRAEDICHALGLTPAALKKVVHKQLGMPLHRYIIERRLDRAESMIKAGVPIAEAALDAGFSSQSHLTSVMSRKRGTTPSALTRAVS